MHFGFPSSDLRPGPSTAHEFDYIPSCPRTTLLSSDVPPLARYCCCFDCLPLPPSGLVESGRHVVPNSTHVLVPVSIAVYFNRAITVVAYMPLPVMDGRRTCKFAIPSVVAETPTLWPGFEHQVAICRAGLRCSSIGLFRQCRRAPYSACSPLSTL